MKRQIKKTKKKRRTQAEIEVEMRRLYDDVFSTGDEGVFGMWYPSEDRYILEKLRKAGYITTCQADVKGYPIKYKAPTYLGLRKPEWLEA